MASSLYPTYRVGVMKLLLARSLRKLGFKLLSRAKKLERSYHKANPVYYTGEWPVAE